MKLRMLTLSSALALAACASTKPYTGETVEQTKTAAGTTITHSESRSILPGGELAGKNALLTEFQATVTNVDLKTRNLSLLTGDGVAVNVLAGPQVQNLDQIRTGDTVKLTYLESVEFEVREPTADEAAMAKNDAVVAARAPKGAQPGAFAAVGGTRIFTIESIDEDKALVTLKDGDRLVTVKAKYPQNLQLAKVGDTVVVKLAEVVAANIQPVG